MTIEILGAKPESFHVFYSILTGFADLNLYIIMTKK